MLKYSYIRTNSRNSGSFAPIPRRKSQGIRENSRVSLPREANDFDKILSHHLFIASVIRKFIGVMLN